MTTAPQPLPTGSANMASQESLGAIDCLGDLPADILSALGQTCRQVFYCAGDIIGGPSAGEATVAFVVTGATRISMPPDRHGDVAFYDANAGGLFGHLEALAEERPGFSAVALNDCSVIFMAADDFRTLVEAHPLIALRILKAQARDAMSATPRAPRRPGSGAHKLYAELLRMAEASHEGSDILLISRLPRHRQLADWTGLGEADVAAGLAELVKSGCAERRYPGLAILDSDKLRQLADQ